MRVPAGELTVASLNTLGIPRPGARLHQRYAAIGAGFEAGDADVVCVQEILTWWHLRLLARRMPSFGQVSYRPSAAGPAGGLVTFSRRPVTGRAYQPFGRPPRARGLPVRTRLQMGRKGALVTRLGRPELWVVNTHPLSNSDGDWSPSNRFYPLHQAQLDALAAVLRGTGGPQVVCGDFNIDRDSALFGGFLRDTGLSDAFGGTCPPTFRAEYLPAGETPHCIDFILATGTVRPIATRLLFAGREPLPAGPGYVSDHIGLSARLSVSPAASS
jgi:endonuclease/exonuclease/phosphatase (EEP) superfamily protein YafD